MERAKRQMVVGAGVAIALWAAVAAFAPKEVHPTGLLGRAMLLTWDTSRAEVLRRLGPPSASATEDGQRRDFWREGATQVTVRYREDRVDSVHYDADVHRPGSGSLLVYPRGFIPQPKFSH